ncbi:MAG TPA: choice-of-anchor B family protein [Actinomycetota bacterium]|nr:choice-of-anchor B family protein [Actinomycetota bacterium]
MHRTTTRISRRVALVGAAIAVILPLVVATTAAAHPSLDEALHPQKDGHVLGIKINSPANLAGFFEAVQWAGTAPVDGQTADLVYAGTGCTPASYAPVLDQIQDNIALVDSRVSATNPADQCPTYTFLQKVRSAQHAGAIGFIQIPGEGEEPRTNATAVSADIPAVEVHRTDAFLAIRDAVIGGTAVNATFSPPAPVSGPLSDVPCVDGMAGPFPCDGVDLLSFVPQEEFNGAGVSDIWGWTDPETGDEYVFFGKTNGTAFFRVTDPTNPVYLGELDNPGLTQGIWHDMKVYENHVFIVSESEPHGMQVFDLTRLRGVTQPQEWTRDGWYRLNSAAHNVAINEETGFAYIVGGNAGILAPDQCLSGLHIVDISTPTNPTFAGCYQRDGGPGTAARSVGAEAVSPAAYVHDAECVIYEGPDDRYTGREICFNASEDQVTIVDVTNKLLPETLGTLAYPDVAYAHQGWLSADQRFLFVNDELDEEAGNAAREKPTDPLTNTRTIVLDVSDLENPKVHFQHFHETVSIDHNNYVHEGLLYQSNYTSGLRVLDTAFVDDPENPRLEQVAFFDTFPLHSNPTFEGTWSNYPFFESGTIAVTGIDEGLFLLRLQEGITSQPAVEIACENCPIRTGPGQQRVARMTVTNVGQVDDVYEVSVEGLPDGWEARIRPAELAVAAGEDGLTTVRIGVPQGTAAGTYDLVVTATSTVDPAVSASEVVQVIVQEGASSGPGRR